MDGVAVLSRQTHKMPYLVIALLTTPSLDNTVFAARNFVSICLHSSINKGFSKWPNTLKEEKKNELINTLQYLGWLGYSLTDTSGSLTG